MPSAPGPATCGGSTTTSSVPAYASEVLSTPASMAIRRSTTVTWSGCDGVADVEEPALDELREGGGDGELAAAGELDEVAHASAAVDQREQRPLVAATRRGPRGARRGPTARSPGWAPASRARPRRPRRACASASTRRWSRLMPTSSTSAADWSKPKSPSGQRSRSNTASVTWSVAAWRISSGSTAPASSRARATPTPPDTARATAWRRAASSTAPEPTTRRTRDARERSELAPQIRPSRNHTTPCTDGVECVPRRSMRPPDLPVVASRAKTSGSPNASSEPSRFTVRASSWLAGTDVGCRGAGRLTSVRAPAGSGSSSWRGADRGPAPAACRGGSTAAGRGLGRRLRATGTRTGGPSARCRQRAPGRGRR